MTGYQIVSESLMFNQDDLYYHVDDWIKGKKKILLVVGYAGSGKTTLGKELARKYKAQYLATDDEPIKELQDLWEDLKKKYPKVFETGTASDNYSKEASKIFLQNAHKVVNKYLNNINKPTVFEGVHLLYWFTPEMFTKYPVVVKGTSHIVSSIRAIKRNLKRNEGNEKNLPWYKLMLWTIMDNVELQPLYNKLVKYLKGLK